MSHTPEITQSALLLNARDNSDREVFSTSLFHTGGSGNSERTSDHSGVTRLGRGRAGISPWVCLTLELAFRTTPLEDEGEKRVRGGRRGKDRTSPRERQTYCCSWRLRQPQRGVTV